MYKSPICKVLFLINQARYEIQGVQGRGIHRLIFDKSEQDRVLSGSLDGLPSHRKGDGQNYGMATLRRQQAG
jgi:hypothetical protein